MPLDGSDNSFRALDAGIFLSKKLDSDIILMYCVSIFPSIEVQIMDPIRCQIEERKYAEKILDTEISIYSCGEYDAWKDIIPESGMCLSCKKEV